MKELFSGLPGRQRPTRILYAASGDHMAPLVACDVDCTDRPYTFIYTEVNPSLREDIDDFLRLLVREGIASKLSAVPPPSGQTDRFAWSFLFGAPPCEPDAGN
jgi:hypothetical protein